MCVVRQRKSLALSNYECVYVCACVSRYDCISRDYSVGAFMFSSHNEYEKKRCTIWSVGFFFRWKWALIRSARFTLALALCVYSFSLLLVNSVNNRVFCHQTSAIVTIIIYDIVVVRTECNQQSNQSFDCCWKRFIFIVTNSIGARCFHTQSSWCETEIDRNPLKML